jgi:hypothetical protein
MLEGSQISTDLNQKGELEVDESKKSLHLNLDDTTPSLQNQDKNVSGTTQEVKPVEQK